MSKAELIIQSLGLQKHPEGGWFRECFRSSTEIPSAVLPVHRKKRCCYTSIYYLLEANDFSSFHRLKSDEIWYFHEGDPVDIYCIRENGELIVHSLGVGLSEGQQPQILIPAGHWFAARVSASGAYALIGCVVSPGFEFEDFQMGSAETLIREFPAQEPVIRQFCRS